ncbi:MAG: hypothetical protein HC824_01520 [Synechococcales cyanobacterium RM1_1_8]|nr:hypothetical protein [Synechococcales cyanobacterium RM1_1_8]
MEEPIHLRLPEPLLQQARDLATITGRTLPDILLEWLQFALSEQPLESLTDSQLLEVCELEMLPEQQESLRELLRRSDLDELETQRLEQLRSIYRQGLIRKAKATQLARARGLLVSPVLNRQGQ